MNKPRTWTFIEPSAKREWGSGSWIEEPDKIQWVDPETDLDCLMLRNSETGGHWCGYVGVPEGHQYFEKTYDDVHVDVHGGLTFSDFCQERSKNKKKCDEERVCHVPYEGRSDRIWWLGFDCAHMYDATPKIDSYMARRMGESIPDWKVYKDVEYVSNECKGLAKQIIEAT